MVRYSLLTYRSITAAKLCVDVVHGNVEMAPASFDDVVGQSYDLEYGQDRVEVQAAVDLVRAHNCKIACCAFVIELSALNGRARLEGCAVESLLQYD
jgi:hypothetical protein